MAEFYYYPFRTRFIYLDDKSSTLIQMAKVFMRLTHLTIEHCGQLFLMSKNKLEAISHSDLSCLQEKGISSLASGL